MLLDKSKKKRERIKKEKSRKEHSKKKKIERKKKKEFRKFEKIRFNTWNVTNNHPCTFFSSVVGGNSVRRLHRGRRALCTLFLAQRDKNINTCMREKT